MINRVVSKVLWGLFALVSIFAVCFKINEHWFASTNDTIEFTDLGINLYGKFRFEAEGDLFDIIDQNNKILVSSGAVLTCIRRSYAIGYFFKDLAAKDGDKSIQPQKIFFTLDPSGKIHYYLPSPDGNFPKTIISESIFSDSLPKIESKKGQ